MTEKEEWEALSKSTKEWFQSEEGKEAFRQLAEEWKAIDEEFKAQERRNRSIDLTRRINLRKKKLVSQ